MRVLFLLFTFVTCASGASAQAFPKATGFVNDFASILDASSRATLEQQLKDVERETTAEIVFVSVTSLDGMSVEEYANKLFKSWGVGKKKQDNGVLVVVAPSDRSMRIEVGYGLEGVLPDGLAGEIIRTQFTPRFKNDDYAGGVRGGMLKISNVVRANHILTADERQRIDHPPVEQGPAWILIPFMGMFVAIGAFAVGLGARTKTVGPILFGLLFFGIPFLICLAIFFFITLFTLGPLALALAVVGYRQGAKVKWRNSVGTKGSGWTMGGGGSSGGSSSGSNWSSGGGSSSSGGSFGGGSSGGGGASGRW
ncbi:MAG: YgcG family protein [Vicinamibacterales bacterium]